MGNLLVKLFDRFLRYYGPRKWWPAKTRFEVIAGAVLTQNVSWKNAKKAINNLKKAGLLSPVAIAKASHQELAEKIKSSRYYNQKAKKLKEFSLFLRAKYSGSLNKLFSAKTEDLRAELLKIKGIGKETADCILLYAGKKPSFVSDAYTKRFLERYGLLNGSKTYDEIRDLFMRNLPQDVYLYNEFHALIDYHGHTVCQSKPDCPNCPVRTIDKKIYCHYGKKAVLLIGILFSTISSVYAQTAEEYNNRGNIDFNQKNFLLAISDYNKAIEINPGYAMAYNNRGLAYKKQGDMIQALSDYNKAIDINPAYAEAYNNRGIVYDDQGDLAPAIADYTKAIEINPKYANAYNNRGKAYYDQKNFLQAISDYTKAIGINRNDAKAFYNRGIAYEDGNNFAQAIADYTQAIDIYPNYAQAYANRGFAYYFEKKIDQARADVRKAEELGETVDPDFISALKKASGNKSSSYFLMQAPKDTIISRIGQGD